MIEINLLVEREEIEEVRRVEPGTMVGLLGGLAVLGVMVAVAVVLYLTSQARINGLREQIQTAQEEVNRLQEALKKVEELERRKQDAERRFQAIEMLAKSRTIPGHLLMEMSRSITDLAWLTRFEVTGNNFHAEGRARQERALTDLIDNLNRSPYFADVKLIDWTAEPNETGRFVIEGRVVNPLVEAEAETARAGGQ